MYIGGISKKIDGYLVRKEFEKFGRIYGVMLKGAYGFIDFEKEKHARRAADELNMKDIFGEGKVTVEMAKYKKKTTNNKSNRCYYC